MLVKSNHKFIYSSRFLYLIDIKYSQITWLVSEMKLTIYIICLNALILRVHYLDSNISNRKLPKESYVKQ